MNFSRTRHLRLIAIGIVALAAGSLVACSPGPEPSPTPTAAFASEEEAFAAAEEVYRAYLEASDRGDSEAQDFLAGSALEDYLDGLDYLKSSDLHLNGTTIIVSFNGEAAEVDHSVATVTSNACIDVSETHVLDAEDKDVTPADRPAIWQLSLTFSGDRRDLLLIRSTAEEVTACD